MLTKQWHDSTGFKPITTYNHGQKIWNKIEKSSKTGQGKKFDILIKRGVSPIGKIHEIKEESLRFLGFLS